MGSDTTSNLQLVGVVPRLHPLRAYVLLHALRSLGAPSYAEETDLVALNHASCSEHLRRHNWNENSTLEEWKHGYTWTVACAQHRVRLAKEAGRERPAAQSGIHVPMVIVPTEAGDLPQLPPFYFALPVYDMVVSNQLRLSGAYDAQELDILLRLTRPGDTFIDIGANLGAVTVPLAAHVGRDGEVYSFEPFRQIFQLLNANVALNGLANVHTFRNALSDADSPGELLAPAPTLEAAQNAGMYSVFQGDSATPNERTSLKRERLETIEVRTLDSFTLPRADVIKIDVEGHARRVLAGSFETLRAHRPILWFEESGNLPAVVLRPELRYWCTKFDNSQTTEDQILCVPKERHEEVQERLNAVAEDANGE